MTIDEAIQRYTDNADYERTHGNLQGCLEFKQLVKWLKELKQEPILDKIRTEVIAKYPKNYAGEPELNGNACEFSLNQILQIIDKYKAEMEGEE